MVEALHALRRCLFSTEKKKCPSLGFDCGRSPSDPFSHLENTPTQSFLEEELDNRDGWPVESHIIFFTSLVIRFCSLWKINFVRIHVYKAI